MKLKPENIALALAALAVYFIVKGRSKTVSAAKGYAPPPNGYFYDKNGTLRQLPPAKEAIFT